MAENIENVTVELPKKLGERLMFPDVMKVKCPIHNVEYDAEAVFFQGQIIGRKGCPLCEKDAESADKRAAALREEQAKKEAREKFLRSANIEPVYANATFETFIAETEEQQRNLNTVRRLTLGEVQQIVMIGKNGTGKTHLGVAAILAMECGLIMSMYEISTKIRETYTPRATETELQVVDRLARVLLLVIDELGRTKGGDAEANWLSYIIDKRHVRNLPTILISNKHVRKTCPNHGCADCLENYIGEDIMSRLNENGVMLRFEGKDYRRTRRV